MTKMFLILNVLGSTVDWSENDRIIEYKIAEC